MKSSSRTSLRRSLETGRRRKSFLKGVQRRLFAERLESREMLAGDIFHNSEDPCDTDRDGYLAPVDILHVINQINEPTSAASGEGPGSVTPYFNDVNNDGYVTPIDALHVINRYNARAAEGEHGPIVRLRVQAVELDKHPVTGLDVPVTTLTKGTDYYLKVLVQDLRNGESPFGTAQGVYAAYLDLLYQKALTFVEIEEIQTLTFGNDPGSGTFTLSFDANGNGSIAGDGTETTSNITFSLAGANPDLTIAANIQTALDAEFGTNNFLVTPVSSGDTNRYSIRFTGRFGDQDVPMMTGNISNLVPQFPPPPALTISFAETLKGFYDPIAKTPATAFRETFRFSPQYNNDAGGANDGQITPFVDPNRFDEAGNFAVGTATLGPAIRELFRVRMNTLDGGAVAITGSVDNMVSPSDDTLVYSGGVNPDGRPAGDVVPASLIDIVNTAAFTVTEPFSAIADTFNFAEFSDTPGAQSLTVKNNDTGALTGVIISALSTTNTSLGTLAIAAGGNSINFVPLANVNGSANFTYTLRNPTTGITDTATVTINISAVNNAPVNTVPGLTQTTPEETAKTINGISIADIDANETVGATVDVDLTVQHGTITLATIPGSPSFTFVSGGNGTAAMVIRGTIADINSAINGLSYTPVQDYTGPDVFRIITNDRGNTGTPGPLSDNDTVAIDVTAVNDAPTVVVPANGTILEGDPLTITGTSTNDVDVGTSLLKVTLDVTGDTAASLLLASVTGLTFTDGTANGQQTLKFTGTLANVNAALASYDYTPPLGDAGIQTISLTVNDQGATGTGGALEGTGQFTVDVIPLVRPFARRDPTVSNPASVAAFTVVEGSSNGALPVLDNDLVDAPVLPATITDKLLISVADSAHGTTSISGDVVLYTPDADFWGTDTFTYVMNQDIDGNATPDGVNSTGTVTVTITNVNDAPVAVDSSDSTNEDTAKDIVLAVSDVDDNNNAGFTSTLTPTVRTAPLHGTATVNANGTIRYTPALNYNGSDSFAYTVSDGIAISGTATVTLTVNPVNDAPVALAGTLTPAEDVATNGTLVATDVDSATLTYSVVSQTNAHGTVLITDASTGAYTYTSALNYNGPASFTFKANDGFLDSNTATVNITVTAVNDVPVANPDSYLVENETLLNANVNIAGNPRATVRANDSDVDNTLASLTVSLEAGNRSPPARPLRRPPSRRSH